MPDLPDFLSPNFPSLAGYLAPRLAAPPVPADIPATGAGNWLTSGFMAGVHGAVSEGARALQAGAQLAGAPGVAQSLSDYAQAAHAREQSYARHDLEEHPWSLPGIGYQIARMVPMGAAALGGGAVATAAAPEVAGAGLLGAAGAMFLPAAGANVQRQISETGELTTPGKALALGVPEAIVQGWLPGRLEKFFGEGILKGIGHAAATQGFAGGATEWMTQKLGDPNRDTADRASAIGSQALSGAALGGIVGGAFGGLRAIAGKPARSVTNPDMEKSIDQALEPRQLTYQPAMRPPLQDVPSGELAGRIDILQRGFGTEPPRQTQASVEELRQLLQEQQRRVAEAAAAQAAAPEPQRLLPPPATREGPPLQTVPNAELLEDFHNARAHFDLNPQNPLAQRIFETLGQEVARRAEAAKAAPAATESAAPAAAEPVAPAAPVAPPEAPREGLAVPAPGEPPVGAPAPGEPPPVVGPAAAALVPVLNFTARLTERAFKNGMAQVAAAPPEAQAAVKQQLIDLLVERGDKKPTVGLKTWGKAFDILTPEGDLKDAFIPERPLEAPPGIAEEVTPEVAPVAPGERLTYASAGAVRRRPLSFEAARAGEPAAPKVPSAWEAQEAEAVRANQEKVEKPWEALEREAVEVQREWATVPIKTADDRAAVFNGVQAEIAKLPDSEIKNQYTAEAETVAKLLPNVEKNPGLGAALNARVARLRAAVEAEAQPPADQVASPDLAPSPRAEVKPAPMGDLDAKLTDAQRELGSLRKALGDRSDAVAALDQHEQWLKTVRDASGPEDLRGALAVDPEVDPEADNLGNLTQLSKPMKDRINAYLTAQQSVLQELRAQGDSHARVISSRDGLPVTQLDADVTDMHQRGVPLTDVADHIIEHTADPEQAEIVARLKQFLPEDAKTVFRDNVVDKEGEYFTKQRTSALYNAANATQTAVHEMVHAVTHQALEGTSAAAKAIRGIYDQLKDKGDHAGIIDAHEMVSEAMANPVYRDFLKSQIVKGTSLWDRFVDIMRRVIGLDPRLYNAFDRIMSHGDDLMKEQKQFPNEWMGPNSYAKLSDEGLKSVLEAAKQAERVVRQQASSGFLDVKGFLRGIGNGWSSGYWLARDPTYNKLSPNIPESVSTLAKEDPRRALIGQMGVVADRQARALPEAAQQLLNANMAASTSYGFHPDRGLPDYREIHDDPARVQQFGITKDLWNKLGQFPGAQQVYNTWRSTMSAIGHMSAILNLQRVEREIPGLNAEDFFKKLDSRADRDVLANDPRQMDVFVQNELTAKIKAGTEFRDQLSAQKATIDTAIEAKPPKDQLKEFKTQSDELGSQIERLNAGLNEAEARQKRMAKEPYFHLGREGDFFVSGKLVTTPGEIDEDTGKPSKAKVNQDVLSKFADHLEKNGVNDVAIMQGNQHGTFYARVMNAAEMDGLAKILVDAQKKGLLSKEAIASGKILDSHIFNRVSSAGMQDIIEQQRRNPPIAPVGASPEEVANLAASHGAQIQNLQRALLSLTPETSMSRLMARRQNVQGFSKDMGRSQAYAVDVSAANIARQSLEHERSAFEAGMLEDVKNANNNPDIDQNTKLGLTSVVSELMRQQRIRQTFVPKAPIDALRNATNTLALGMSPSYSIMQLGQLGITGLPELAKTHGYGSAFAAMQRALSPALQVVNAIARSPDGLTAGITRAAMERQGLPQALINTIMGMVNRGSLGTYTKSVTERSPTDGIGATVLKAANVMGLYSDLAPRLIMGLAADNLYTAKPYAKMTKEQFTDHVINESQGYWGAALGARQTSKAGPLGAMTPLFTQFMQWSIHMSNKIYREAYDSFKGEDAQTRKEARTWLAGHAAATTMLAGTLGLPVLSVAASVYDKLADWFTNRDDHDITASYRNFLADTFGKDTGEIIARGLPRAAGLDFTHWGEGEIVPGTSLLNKFLEKRKFEDMENDWFKSAGGPALNKLFQFGQAARDLTNGDYLDGLIKMSPGLISGAAQAYQLGTDGFVNTRTGQKLPMTANAYDVALKALGITPAKQAEYREVAGTEAGLRAMREASSANISQHLQQAYTQGDQGALRAWMAEAQRWQAQHPNLVSPQASFGHALANHMRQSAVARGMGLPIGVSPQDVSGRGALRYGNIPVQ